MAETLSRKGVESGMLESGISRAHGHSRLEGEKNRQISISRFRFVKQALNDDYRLKQAIFIP